jgi:uncharacterized protein YaaQ
MNRSPEEVHQHLKMETNRRPERTAGKTKRQSDPVITKLLGAVIHIQDRVKTQRALDDLGVRTIQLSSTGAFLAKENVTLLVAAPDDMYESVLRTLAETCKPRTAYISTNIETAALPTPITTPVPIGGATVFTIDLDRFEEF